MIGLRAICGSICRARFRTENEIDAHSAIFSPRFVQRVRNREDVTPADKNNEPLDAILRRATPAQPGPATPECADAESLAAYSDRSLSIADRDRLETHFADCMRCQLLLADIARADQGAREAQAASEVPWYRRWRIAIPALAAVAAVVVFVAIKRPANEEPQSGQLIAMAKSEPPRMELAERAQAPVAPFVAAAAAAPASNEELAMNEPKPAAAFRTETLGGAILHRMNESAAAPAARAMIAQSSEPAAKTGAMQSYGAAVAGNALNSNAGYAEQAGVLATIAPSDRSVTWIVGRNGMIRRLDAHGNQHALRSGVSTDLVAGAAPSSSVCWVVGRAGTIIRTTDGEHWSVVASPTAEDLVTVSSGGASDATVTTSTAKSFVTTDGGATWHQQ